MNRKIIKRNENVRVCVYVCGMFSVYMWYVCGMYVVCACMYVCIICIFVPGDRKAVIPFSVALVC